MYSDSQHEVERQIHTNLLRVKANSSTLHIETVSHGNVLSGSTPVPLD